MIPIKHRPILNTDNVIKKYSEKDNTPIKYVCTSSLNKRGMVYDIFYRADNSPHPEFGNRYFGITTYKGVAYIANADNIENLLFYTVNGVYSQNEHDFVDTLAGVCIDGGRDYLRLVGDIRVKVLTYKIKNGEFVLDDTV